MLPAQLCHVKLSSSARTLSGCQLYAVSFVLVILLLLPQVDALLMKHFLSAFSDEDCALILKHCRQVLGAAQQRCHSCHMCASCAGPAACAPCMLHTCPCSACMQQVDQLTLNCALSRLAAGSCTMHGARHASPPHTNPYVPQNTRVKEPHHLHEFKHLRHAPTRSQCC